MTELSDERLLAQAIDQLMQLAKRFGVNLICQTCGCPVEPINPHESPEAAA